MAKEIQVAWGSSGPLYGIPTQGGQYYNSATPGLENFNSANWANYVKSLTQAGNLWTADFTPAQTAEFEILVYLQAGGSPVYGTDTFLAAGPAGPLNAELVGTSTPPPYTPPPPIVPPVFSSNATIVPTPYCSLTDIQNRLSVNGVNLRIDDVPPTTLGDVIADASTIIDEHCFTQYDPAKLAVSGWIQYRAADIATYLLCERRGNPAPASVANRFERAMKALERVQAGSMIVYDIPPRRTPAPTMSNVRVILRPFPRSVVEYGTLRSTGKVTDYARTYDPFYLAGGGDAALNWSL